MDSEPAVKTVMTTALRNRNIATAALLIGFVGGAYVWTTSKMSTVRSGGVLPPPPAQCTRRRLSLPARGRAASASLSRSPRGTRSPLHTAPHTLTRALPFPLLQNELSEAVSELDEVRALKAQHAAPPAAGSGAKPSGPR